MSVDSLALFSAKQDADYTANGLHDNVSALDAPVKCPDIVNTV